MKARKIEDTWKGLQILSRYSSRISSEKMIIYAGPDLEKVSEEDRKKLDELGWLYEGDGLGWSILV